MPSASLRLDLRQGGARLNAVAADLRKMDAARVKEIFKRHIEDAARPFPARVRASVLAIPTHGDKHTGLRARIAACVTLSSGTDDKSAYVSVWVDPSKMDGYKTLPLYMEGAKKRWRHPVYGTWRTKCPTEDPHPYFYQAADPLGRAAGEEMKAALDDISRELRG